MDKKLIFIVGNSRSGTTMMSRMLGLHPEIFSFAELHVFEQFLSAKNLANGINRETATDIIGRILSIQKNGFFYQHNPADFKEESGHIIESVSLTREGTVNSADIFFAALKYVSAQNGKTIPCEQTPRNLFYLKEILELYPEANIIYMVRDPRDVLLSQKNKWRRRFLGAKNIPLREAFRAWVNYHPYTISKLWSANEQMIKKFRNNPRILEIQFEKLLHNPEQELRKICSAFNISFDSNMLNIPVVGSSLGQDSPDKKGVDASRTGNWQRGGLTTEEIVICQSVCEKDMIGRGYIVESLAVSTIKLVWLYTIWPLKIALALLLNINRTHNMLDSIRRRFLM